LRKQLEPAGKGKLSDEEIKARLAAMNAQYGKDESTVQAKRVLRDEHCRLLAQERLVDEGQDPLVMRRGDPVRELEQLPGVLLDQLVGRVDGQEGRLRKLPCPAAPLATAASSRRPAG